MSSFEQIKKDIAENDVVLYMKGTSDFPQCGFSGLVVSILKKLNVKFKYINVLENGEIRESIKKFSDWPTIPQLYIKEEFIGGCDITREMYEKGELQNLLKEKKLLRNKYQETSAQTLDNVVYYEKGSYVLNLIIRLNK